MHTYLMPHRIDAAIDAILTCARRNPAITAAGLIDEMERGAMEGWASLPEVRRCNFAEWTAAMRQAAAYLQHLADRRAAATARRRQAHQAPEVLEGTGRAAPLAAARASMDWAHRSGLAHLVDAAEPFGMLCGGPLDAPEWVPSGALLPGYGVRSMIVHAIPAR